MTPSPPFPEPAPGPPGSGPPPVPPPPAGTDRPQSPLPLLTSFPAPAAQQRWTVLIRWILAVPLAVVLAFIGIAAGVVVFIGWFGALFTGRMPDFARNLTVIYLRMTLRL